MTTGAQIISLAEKHIGEKYVLGVIAPKNQESYTGPWDCAEFMSFIVYQLTQRLYGCANNNGRPDTADAYSGFWPRDAKEIGTLISINDGFATPGAALIRTAGNGLIGHSVFSDGKGGTVEAHSSKRGVIRNVVTGRRWDYAILVPWIDYTKNTIPDIRDVNQKPVEKIYRFTHPMMNDPFIKKIQAVLKIPADGLYGQQTFNAVKAFQRVNGLVADGEVGAKNDYSIRH